MAEYTDRSFSSVLQEIVGNVQGIIRSEVRLAKAEIKEETVKAGKAAGILATGAILALYAVGFLLLTCLFALRIAVNDWLAALIITLLIGTGAAVLINVGLTRIKRVDPRPDKTIHTMKENLEWAKNQTR